MKTELVQHYTVDTNGKSVLQSEETVEVQGPTIEEKEAELLALYEEIKVMKAGQV
tara:strand:+ start:540 stop:704 length:165 start_codon:yes stop_codon:yes gene_type:complete